MIGAYPENSVKIGMLVEELVEGGGGLGGIWGKGRSVKFVVCYPDKQCSRSGSMDVGCPKIHFFFEFLNARTISHDLIRIKAPCKFQAQIPSFGVAYFDFKFK